MSSKTIADAAIWAPSPPRLRDLAVAVALVFAFGWAVAQTGGQRLDLSFGAIGAPSPSAVDRRFDVAPPATRRGFAGFGAPPPRAAQRQNSLGAVGGGRSELIAPGRLSERRVLFSW